MIPSAVNANIKLDGRKVFGGVCLSLNWDLRQADTRIRGELRHYKTRSDAGDGVRHFAAPLTILVTPVAVLAYRVPESTIPFFDVELESTGPTIETDEAVTDL